MRDGGTGGRGDGRTGRGLRMLIALAIVLSALPPVLLSAQSPEAAAIIDRAVAAFAKVETLRADITMRLNDPMLGTDLTSHGEYIAKRPNKFAMKWRQPPGDVILSDGRVLWVYLPSTTPGQVIRSTLQRGSSPDVLAEFLERPREHFTITFVRADSVGRRPVDVLSMTPTQEGTAYQRVLAWIDRQDNLPHRFDITETSGQIRHVTLDRIRVNTTVRAAEFVFTPPSGARVVDATQP